MADDEKTPPLAYLNDEFLNTPDARVMRIAAEYLEPAARLRHQHIRDTIVVFGSARSLPPEEAQGALKRALEAERASESPSPELKAAVTLAQYGTKLSRYYQDSMELSRRLTEWSNNLTGNRHFVICSGGSGGMMEAANRGAAAAGGKTIGLNIKLPAEQSVNPYVSPELVFNFHYFFMRKFWFIYPAKALIAFPGGFGTVDELFEVLTLIQTKMPRKVMPVVLFGAPYWDEMINFDAMVRWGVISPADLNTFYKTDSVDEAFTYLTETLERMYLTPQGLDEVKLT